MINDLKSKQAELDQYIYDKQGVQAKDIFEDKVIALEAELSELANELGFFKYWKQSHKKDADAILEEYADVIHFTLGLANDLGVDMQYTKPKFQDMRVLYLGIKNMVTILPINNAMFNQLFSTIWYFGTEKIGLSEKQIRDAYDRKYQKNIGRQQNFY